MKKIIYTMLLWACFSVGSWSDFCNMVDKTIKYEKKYNSSNEALLVAHMEDAPWSFQECCDHIYGDHYSDMTFIKAYGAPYYLGGQ